jgi:hypothetical protein
MKTGKYKFFCVVAILFLLAGCSSFGTWSPVIQQKIDSIDWLTLTENSVTAVANLQRFGKIGIGLPCKFGVLDADICALYKLADDAATPALLRAREAIAAYKLNPTAGNEGLLAAAYYALNDAWATFNLTQDKAEAVPIPSPAQ